MKNDYTAKSIQVLEGLEPVRKRPGMYIGGTSLEGLHHLVWEVVNNCVDEAMAGYSKNIQIKLLPDNRVEVADDGRGIPVEKHPQTKKSTLETVLTMLHAGGKFGGSGYKISGGLHGVGVSVVNALSQWMRAEIKRDGKIYAMEFERGKSKSKEPKIIGKTKETGTKIIFQADPEIFPEIRYSWEKILNYLRQQSYLTKGLCVKIYDQRAEGKEISYGFLFDGGLISYIKFLNRGKEVKNEMPFYVEKTMEDILVEIATQYTESYKEHVFSFANNIFTPEGGTHEAGFRSALTRAMNSFAKKTGILKDKDENFTAEDIQEGLTAVISVKLRNPQFEGQTKAKLGNSEVRGVVSSVTAEALNEYLEAHPNNAKAIVSKLALTAKARIAARAAKDAVIRKGALEGMTLPGKLADCTSRDAAQAELYIVEGDSAGGCWDGDTKVALVDGRYLSFKELVEEDKRGKINFCYTMQNNGHIGIAPIVNPRITKKNIKVIKLTLDNGENLICTPDHPFRLVNGTYVSAEKLTTRHNIAPLYKKLSKKEGSRSLDGYEMVFDPKSKKWIYTHVLSNMYNLRSGVYKSSAGKHRHHADFNKLNNNPTNIQRFPYEKHMKLHYDRLEKTLHRPDVKIKSAEAKRTVAYREKARKKSLEKSALFSKNAKKQWENPEYKKFMIDKFLKFYNSNEEYRKGNNLLLNKVQKSYWGKKENRKKQGEKVRKYFQDNPNKAEELSKTAKRQWNNKDLLSWRSAETKKQWTNEFRKKRKKTYDQTYLSKGLKLMRSIYDKHKILSEKLYDKERRELNDKSIIRMSTICERFFDGDGKKLKEAVLNYNHKIKSIEKLKKRVDVYDLEVPETRNFALASGVFVHNSAKQGRDRRFQAILPLRGKLVNVEKTTIDKVVKSDTLKPIIIALGAGISESFNLEKLRYHKIIIMADADVDGSHIRTLLLTFFYRYFETLIRNGNIYIAQPPLYRIQKGKDIKYAYTEEEKNRLIAEIKKKEGGSEKEEKEIGINIQRYKGLGEMNPQQLWETTMDPQNRMMLQVGIGDAEAADKMFDVLMGSEVEPRRRFIQTHAKSVKNLDV